MKKPLSEMTPEEVSAEVSGWESGAFADGTWVDAPEAIIANERFYYLRGEDGVRRAIILCTPFSQGTIFERGRGNHPRVYLAVGSWESLNEIQKTGLCQFIWAGMDEGDIVVIDAKADQVIATHRVPTHRVPTHSVPAETDSGSTPEGNDWGDLPRLDLTCTARER